MTVTLTGDLAALPPALAEAIDDTYRSVMDHFLKEEWDDAQVDAVAFARLRCGTSSGS